VKLTPLEIAGGLPLGMNPEAEPLPDVGDITPLAAFEDVVRAALQRPPCVVTFSGGRDSAAILAVAARIAREETLEPPIVVTVLFEGGLGTGEAKWQERVIAHSRVERWIRLTVGEEIDFVGPVARPLLKRYGVVHPPHFPFFWLPVQYARNGSMLTGFGGDSVIGGWIPAHAAEVIAGHAWPRPSDLTLFAFAVAPPFVRRQAMQIRLTRPVWLRRQAFKEFIALRVEEFASRPLARDSFLAWEARRRTSIVTESTLARLGADVGATVFHPLHDRRFVAALARDLGARGGGDRTSIMRRVFAGDLPDDVLTRSGKANFAVAYFRKHTRAFARRWDGIGLDTNLVEPELLRKTWLDLIPDSRSALALQAAWLSSAERGLEEPVADFVEGSEVARSRDTPDREPRDFEQRGRPGDLRPAMPRESNQSV
jgi:asparagine synthetase B (glutamine-hydrolysing)